MTAARVVIFASDRAFRVGCNAALRTAGVLVRMASRQAELAKAMREGGVAVILVDADPRDRDVVRTLADVVPVMHRAPGESIEEIVARALGVTVGAGDQPRSSE